MPAQSRKSIQSVLSMNKKLDVAIIATVRPEILRMTLQSFGKNLFCDFDCRAIINVDPAGDTENYSQMDVVDVCREYFDEVIHRTPEILSFGGAVKWCWQQVQTEFFFHLEDDWILKRKIDGREWLSVFEDPAVVELVLNKFGSNKKPPLQWNPKLASRICNERFLIAEQLLLNPAFFRTAYIQQIVDRMNDSQDPEGQWEEEPHKLITNDYPAPLFLWHISPHPLIIDTGTLWRKAKQIRKYNKGEHTYWEESRKWLFAIDRKIQWAFLKRYWTHRYCRDYNLPKKEILGFHNG